MKIPRKAFLKTAGATLAGLGFLYPGLAATLRSSQARPRPSSTSAGAAPATTAPNVQRLDGPDPTYAAGRVVGKTAQGVVLRIESREVV